MTIVSRLTSWLRRRRNRTPSEEPIRERREFVYLDEVSVLSILASLTGRITTESTESQNTTQSSEVKGSLGVGLGGTKANHDTMTQSSQVEASQVSRKAIIQTSFKELYDIECSALALRPVSKRQLPRVDSMLDLERLLGSPEADGLLVDPSTLVRGGIVEVEVELHSDPIFRLATIISTFVGLMEDNEELMQDVLTAQLPRVRSVARLLDSLLAGLVPIRGRLVDFEKTRINNRDILVHRSLLRQIPTDERPESYPVLLVGVAQRDLFWKDIRRVLFSQAQYTVFGRLAADGLVEKWNPVKMADVFSGITSDFDEMIRGLGDELMSGFNRGVHSAPAGTTDDGIPAMLNHDATRGKRILTEYVESIARYHKQDIKPIVIEDLTCVSSRAGNWLHSVDSYRPVFAEVTNRVDTSLGTETPPRVAHDLRLRAVRTSSLDTIPKLDRVTVGESHTAPRCEWFLDSEIVAIYW